MPMAAVSQGGPARARLLAVALTALSACASSAPHTLPALGINAAAGLGVAARQRAIGGCFATCAYGTQCNPRTGFCEQMPCGTCAPGESCVLAEGEWRCAAGGAGTATVASTGRVKAAPAGQLVPGIGISPLTGSIPPPPNARPDAR